ncbi:MAG: recombinase RecA [Thermaerobacter sp.]|nr:recombinase RecA [Thermaerobacter sp.]
MDRERALDIALAQIEKQFGKGSIMKLGEAGAAMQIEAIPTGAITLDVALGIGGVPRGRVIEIYGPESSGKTTVALHIIAEAQAAGGYAAFIDAEHALDPVYAKNLGVNTDELLISQPDTGEQALEIAEALVRSGAIDVIVIDSVAALVPKAEIEGEMGDTHVGLQARLMSQALRKLTGVISKSNTSAIFINQLREKVGVMFGCLSYRSKVRLADGTTEYIGKIVNHRMPVEVLSWDPAVGKVVPRPVLNWYNNGRTDRFLQISAHYPGGNGRSQVSCTDNHPVLTPRGWRRAGKLRVGDEVMVAVEHRLSAQQIEVIKGSLLGDGCLAPTRRSEGFHRPVRFRLGHNARQIPYLDWKSGFLANIPRRESVSAKGAKVVDTSPLPELQPLYSEVYREGGKHFSARYIDALTPFALAIWIMDDATLTLQSKARTAGRYDVGVEAMDAGTRERLAAWLTEKLEAKVTLTLRGRAQKAYLRFDQAATHRLSALIAPFVHLSMDYKLLPEHRGMFTDPRPEFVTASMKPVPAPILDIHDKPVRRGFNRFDIEVADSHNFLADNIIVHNSPETTPGGRALKFYASVRLEVRRTESLKQGTEVVGNRTRVRVVKNKVAPPFKQAEFDIIYGEGISKEGSLVDLGTEMDIIQKSGAWYSYGGERLGQGRENVRDYLKQHKEIAQEVEVKIREALLQGKVEAPVAGRSEEADE